MKTNSAFLLLCLSACAAPRPPAADAGQVLELEAYCRDFYSATADFQVRCGVMSPGGAAEFAAVLSLTCRPSRDRHIDAIAGASCLEHLRNGSCVTGLPKVCFEAWVGEQTLGEACGDGSCAPGLYCEHDQACPGVCTPRIEAGQLATGECAGVQVDGWCVDPLPVGASCAAADGGSARLPCVSGAICTNDDRCTEIVIADVGQYCEPEGAISCRLGASCVGDGCQALSMEGAPCRRAGCQYDLSCDPESGRCIGPGSVGAACGNARCRQHLFCDGSEGCQPRLTEGAPCAYGAAQCAFGLTCRFDSVSLESFCARPAPRDTPCSVVDDDSFCEEGLFCLITGSGRGSCVELRPGGAKCSESRQCSSQLCNADGGCAELPFCFVR